MSELMDWTPEGERDAESRKQNAKAWGYKITRDYLDPKGTEYSRHGVTKRDYQGGKNKYRLLDDDGTVYYAIESDIAHDEGTESQLFAPLDWGMAYAGCTEIQYKTDEGWRTL